MVEILPIKGINWKSLTGNVFNHENTKYLIHSLLYVASCRKPEQQKVPSTEKVLSKHYTKINLLLSVFCWFFTWKRVLTRYRWIWGECLPTDPWNISIFWHIGMHNIFVCNELIFRINCEHYFIQYLVDVENIPFHLFISTMY